jgi:molybdopterin converting factor small subunit
VADQTDTLGDALPREMTRVRRLIPMYQSIGPAGGFAIMMMNRALDEAQKALAEGDVVAMIRAYEDLKGFHE